VRTCVILNPVAGSGNSVAGVQRAVASIPGAEIRVSDGPASIERLTRAAVTDGFQRIVAAGGDGTVSEVASTVLAAGGEETGLECGVLPIGTGNDLALALGIPPGLERAAALLQSGSARPIDTIVSDTENSSGYGAERAFTWNAVVGGFGGRVSDHLTPERKHRWHRLAYLRAAIAELGELSSHAVRIEMDGQRHELDLLMLVIANGSHAGGGIPLAPGARLDDGALDVVGIRAGSPFDVLRLVLPVLSGRHLDHPGVFHARGRTVSVESDPGFRYNRDGEEWGSGNARFEICPDAIAFLRP
jgi:diacylglycerol kinase (ATP)